MKQKTLREDAPRHILFYVNAIHIYFEPRI